MWNVLIIIEARLFYGEWGEEKKSKRRYIERNETNGEYKKRKASLLPKERALVMSK